MEIVIEKRPSERCDRHGTNTERYGYDWIMTKPLQAVDLMHESDRGAVIVGAAILDDVLTDLLNDVFRANNVAKRQIEKLFDLSGPLSSFGSKTLVCYAFGLITKPMFDDLNGIRGLRNKFAHSTDTVDFLSPEVTAAVLALNCAKQAESEFKGKRYSLPPGEPRDDWELLRKGFGKRTKSLFVIGVKCLHIDILKQHHLSLAKAGVLRPRGDSTN